MTTQPLLQLSNLTTTYSTGRGLVRAVDGINLVLEQGRILGLVGESGCGKSTVLLSILGLIRNPGMVSGGEILFHGHDLRTLTNRQMQALRGKEIAMIFQDPLSTLNPVFPVGEQIREALQLHHILGRPRLPSFVERTVRRREKAQVIKVMDEVGIPDPDSRYRAYPHQFSGGMQQRVLIAIALACNPALLLADEPTTALDVTIQAQILDLMRKINREHHTAIILVTHDLAVASEFCDSIAVMYAGRIVENGDIDQVIETPQHPYTQGLLRCRPRIITPRPEISPIPGNVPDLIDLPSGCAFASRCPLVRESCYQGPVPLIETETNHLTRCLIFTNYRRSEEWTWSDRIYRELI